MKPPKKKKKSRRDRPTRDIYLTYDQACRYLQDQKIDETALMSIPGEVFNRPVIGNTLWSFMRIQSECLRQGRSPSQLPRVEGYLSVYQRWRRFLKTR